MDRERLGLRGLVREMTESADGRSGETLVFDRDGRLVLPDRMARSRLVREQVGPDGTLETVEDVSNPGHSKGDVFWQAPCANDVILCTRGAEHAVTAYSKSGRPMCTKFTNASGIALERSEYRYDEAGRVVEIVSFRGEEAPEDAARIAGMIREASQRPGAVLSREAMEVAERFSTAGSELSRIEFRYDGAGRVTERLQWTFGWPSGRVVYEYNAGGDVVRQQNDKDPEYLMEYEYDSRGNWTRKVTRCLDWRGETSRRITYYD